jgi:hypothetical protein
MTERSSVRESRLRVYRVIFTQQGNLYEVYARHVAQSTMLGFIELGQLLFGDQGKVVIDPSEERLKTEFQGVRRVYVPIHSVVRVDEVERKGPGRITAIEGGNDERPTSKVSPFPFVPPPTPRSPEK